LIPSISSISYSLKKCQMDFHGVYNRCMMRFGSFKGVNEAAVHLRAGMSPFCLNTIQGVDMDAAVFCDTGAVQR